MPKKIVVCKHGSKYACMLCISEAIEKVAKEIKRAKNLKI